MSFGMEIVELSSYTEFEKFEIVGLSGKPDEVIKIRIRKILNQKIFKLIESN